MGAVTATRPSFAAPGGKVRSVLDIILHIGAHRTASTSFQAYLRENAGRLLGQGVGYWGPLRTRRGVLTGIQPEPGQSAAQKRRAVGRLHLRCTQAADAGVRQLLISDENMPGTPQGNIGSGGLYPAMGERMARFGVAFGGRVSRVVLSVRSQESYWASILAMSVARGHALPRRAKLEKIAQNPRRWREVITDLACAMPDVPLEIMPHETYAGLPERRLSRMLNGAIPTPRTHARLWLNRAPDLPHLREALRLRGENPAALQDGNGHWHPFDAAQVADLRSAYADDLTWLRAGADGLANLITETAPEKMGMTPHDSAMTRGQDHDRQKGRVA
ncbi:hypothetical protein [Thalassovita taeanensis]